MNWIGFTRKISYWEGMRRVLSVAASLALFLVCFPAVDVESPSKKKEPYRKEGNQLPHLPLHHQEDGDHQEDHKSQSYIFFRFLVRRLEIFNRTLVSFMFSQTSVMTWRRRWRRGIGWRARHTHTIYKVYHTIYKAYHVKGIPFIRPMVSLHVSLFLEIDLHGMDFEIKRSNIVKKK